MSNAQTPGTTTALLAGKAVHTAAKIARLGLRQGSRALKVVTELFGSLSNLTVRSLGDLAATVRGIANGLRPGGRAGGATTPTPPTAAVGRAGASAGDDAARASATMRADLPIASQKQAGHIPGTPQYANRIKQGKTTSAFFGEKSGNAWTQKAWREGTPIPGNPNMKIYDAGVSVGTGPNGGMQTQVRVSIDSQGRLHGTPWGPEK